MDVGKQWLLGKMCAEDSICANRPHRIGHDNVSFINHFLYRLEFWPGYLIITKGNPTRRKSDNVDSLKPMELPRPFRTEDSDLIILADMRKQVIEKTCNPIPSGQKAVC